MSQDRSHPVADAAHPSIPRFETSPYRPDGGCPPVGALFVAATTFLGAVILGWLVSFIGQWLYLIVIFPVALGFGVGLVGSWAVRRGKVRNPVCAGILGLAAGCLAMVAVHYFDYERFLGELEKVIPGARARGPSFLTFVDVMAQRGVHIGKVGHGNDKGFNLGYVGSYIYWALEVLGVGLFSFALVRLAAQAPFCTACNTWKEERKLGQVSMPAHAVVSALTTGEIVKLAEADFHDTKGTLVFKAAVCPKCGEEAPVDVRLEQITVNEKGQQNANELAHMTYPGEALAVLESLAQAASPVSAAAPAEAGEVRNPEPPQV